MAKVVLFLNGEKPTNIPNLTIYEKVFCTDGALQFLVQNQVVPDVVIGDFDSIEQDLIPKETKTIKIDDQNTTDFEKALTELISKGHKDVDVYSASGLEQDHFLGNLSAALKFKHQIKIQFFDEFQTYWFLEKQETIHTEINKKISLFPFPKALKVNSTGLKYPLKDLDLTIGKQIGTRNVSTKKEVSVQFAEGELVVFVGK